MITGWVSMIMSRIARFSGWEFVTKSRFMSNPLAFARVPATRPSGFAVTLK